MISSEQKAAVMLDVLQAILTTVREAGPMGAPSSHVYLALAAHGCTLETFQTLMGILVDSGKVRFGADCRYFAVYGMEVAA